MCLINVTLSCSRIEGFSSVVVSGVRSLSLGREQKRLALAIPKRRGFCDFKLTVTSVLGNRKRPVLINDNGFFLMLCFHRVREWKSV